MLCLITYKVRAENRYGFLRPGLKTGVGNGIFWSEIGSGFGDVGGTPPPKIPRSTSPGHFCHPEILQFLEDNFNIVHKELPCIKFHWLPGVNLYLTCFLLYVRRYANDQKCKQWRQQRSPYKPTSPRTLPGCGIRSIPFVFRVSLLWQESFLHKSLNQVYRNCFCSHDFLETIMQNKQSLSVPDIARPRRRRDFCQVLFSVFAAVHCENICNSFSECSARPNC